MSIVQQVDQKTITGTWNYIEHDSLVAQNVIGLI